MNSIAPWFIAASAAILLFLGLMHVLITFYGPKLFPSDPELKSRMHQVSLVITNQTTMWKCWIGFNASHGSGLILFGMVYGYLSLVHGDFLFQSVFLLALGLILLLSSVFLAKKYFFKVPLWSLVLATVLYSFGLATR